MSARAFLLCALEQQASKCIQIAILIPKARQFVVF